MLQKVRRMQIKKDEEGEGCGRKKIRHRLGQEKVVGGSGNIRCDLVENFFW